MTKRCSKVSSSELQKQQRSESFNLISYKNELVPNILWRNRIWKHWTFVSRTATSVNLNILFQLYSLDSPSPYCGSWCSPAYARSRKLLYHHSIRKVGMVFPALPHVSSRFVSLPNDLSKNRNDSNPVLHREMVAIPRESLLTLDRVCSPCYSAETASI